MRFALFLSSVIILTPFNANAEQPQQTGLNGSIGAGILVLPEYIGSDETELFMIPFIRATYAFNPSHYLFMGQQGLGYGFKPTENLDIGLVASFRRGRDENDDAFVRGMRELDHTAEAGVFARWQSGKWTHGITWMSGVSGDNNGALTRLNTSYRHMIGQRWQVSASAGVTYADNAYMDDYFSVKSTEARVGRPAFEAESGFSDVDASLMVNHFLTKKHSIIAGMTYTRFLGDAKESSLSQTDGFVSGLIGYGYKF